MALERLLFDVLTMFVFGKNRESWHAGAGLNAALRARAVARPVAAILCALTLWMPFYAVWADAITAAAQAGQLAGQTMLPQSPPATADSSGNITLYPNSNTPTTLSAGQLFPGATGDFTPFTSTYGNDSAMITQGNTAQTTLSTAASYTGESYRTVVQSNLIARPDMRSDPIWQQTDNTFNNLTALSSTFGDCRTSTTTTTGTITSHIPDYKVCEVVNDPSASCSLTHSYSATYHPLCEQDSYYAGYVRHPDGEVAATGEVMCSGGFRYARVSTSDSFYWSTPGPGCETSSSGWVNISAWTNGMSIGSGNNGETEARLTQENPSAFLLERLGAVVCGSDQNTGATVCDASATYVPYDPNTGTGGYYVIAGSNVGSYTWNSVDICGGPSGNAVYSATLTIPANTQVPYYDPIVENWGGLTQQCQTALNYASQGVCTVTATCTQMPPTDANGCTTLSNGKYICPSDLGPAPVPGISNLCQQASLTVNCGAINQGQLSCYIDINGNLQCPVNNGGNPDGCAQYRTDPNCGFISSQCLTGLANNTGTCYVTQQTWDCGSTLSVPTTSMGSTYNCVGPIRCMGTECVTPKPEQNHDFARVAGIAQAIQALHNDGSCTNPADPSTCTIFAGKPGTCKRAVGGVVDCCKSPGGVSLAQYLELISAVSKLDDAIMSSNNMQGTVLRGAWETLREPVDVVQANASAAWDMAKDWFSSAWNSLSGSATATATTSGSEAAASVTLQQFEQQMTNQVAQWVYQTFGQNAANALFVDAAGSGTASNALSSGGSVSINPAVTDVLGTIAAVYMYYTIALIIINLIWQCEQSELELDAKRDLKLCHYVGSYCSQDTLFGCLETKQTYCCYNSPLSRIIEEQIHPLDGASWGTPQSPICDGVNLLTLNTIDWSKVDLSEWIGILYANGRFPTAANTNMDSLTGSGSFLNIYGNRLNAADRTSQRIGGNANMPPLDTTGVRDAAAQTLR